MQLFYPPNSIAEQIGWTLHQHDNQSIAFTKHIIFPNHNGGEGIAIIVDSALTGIRSFFREEIPQNSFNNQEAGTLIVEALTNACRHGSKRQNDEVIFGLFLGRKGACYGFKDKGTYFKKPENKTRYEKKQLLEKAKGAGTGLTFDYSDIIEVDTKEGVLYCTQFLERLKKTQ